jgi:hypothetical protein
LSWAQEGFKLIRKAEKKIENGRYTKALSLLDRAENSNYGFCGNAWLEADDAIAKNRVKIYDALNEPFKAAEIINSLEFFYSNDDLDSIKTAYYVDALGKELVKNEIDSCINRLQAGLMDSIHRIWEIELATSFTEDPFVITNSTLSKALRESMLAMNENLEGSFFEEFKAAIRRQPFYQLLI